MFTFIPQLLIILSLAGIIFIVVRRTPELKIPIPVHLKNAENFLIRWLKATFQQLWQFTLEVKEVTRKTEATLSQHLPRHLPKLRLPSFSGFGKNSAEFFIKQGETALETGDQAGAEQSFINALKKDPKNETAFAYLGRLYLAQNKTNEAVETYKFLLKHHPENAVYIAGMGQAYFNQQKYDNAISAFEQAAELEPDNAKHFLSLAAALEDKNHLEEAILNYKRAVELAGEDSQITLKLCDALIKKGDKQEAETVLEKLLLHEPTNKIAREKLMQIKY